MVASHESVSGIKRVTVFAMGFGERPGNDRGAATNVNPIGNRI
jgi:hypothetical protein